MFPFPFYVHGCISIHYILAGPSIQAKGRQCHTKCILRRKLGIAKLHTLLPPTTTATQVGLRTLTNVLRLPHDRHAGSTGCPVQAYRLAISTDPDAVFALDARVAVRTRAVKIVPIAPCRIQTTKAASSFVKAFQCTSRPIFGKEFAVRPKVTLAAGTNKGRVPLGRTATAVETKDVVHPLVAVVLWIDSHFAVLSRVSLAIQERIRAFAVGGKVSIFHFIFRQTRAPVKAILDLVVIPRKGGSRRAGLIGTAAVQARPAWRTGAGKSILIGDRVKAYRGVDRHLVDGRGIPHLTSAILLTVETSANVQLAKLRQRRAARGARRERHGRDIPAVPRRNVLCLYRTRQDLEGDDESCQHCLGGSPAPSGARTNAVALPNRHAVALPFTPTPAETRYRGKSRITQAVAVE